KRYIETQDEKAILSCFDKIRIQPGDVFFVPGGMPHAIGEGVFMIEIMEPTDLAVRIEFERGGYVLPEESRFMNRGINFALSMFSFEAYPVERIKEKYFCEPRILDKQGRSTEYILIDEQQTPCFRVHRIDVHDHFEKKYNTFYIGIVSKGAGIVRIDDQSYTVNAGMKFFIPYKTGPVRFESEVGMEIIATFPP
ncbi:MAG: hypothetical protein WD052_11335, partial [Bacteroidales bacterium]